MPYANLTIPYKKKSGRYTGVSARISSAFSAAVRRRSLLRAEFFPEEGLDAARLQNGQDEITKNLALHYLAALHAGERAVLQIQLHRLAVFHMLRRALANEQRQAEIDAVAVEDAGEAVGHDRRRAHVQKRDRRMLS